MGDAAVLRVQTRFVTSDVLTSVIGGALERGSLRLPLHLKFDHAFEVILVAADGEEAVRGAAEIVEHAGHATWIRFLSAAPESPGDDTARFMFADVDVDVTAPAGAVTESVAATGSEAFETITAVTDRPAALDAMPAGNAEPIALPLPPPLVDTLDTSAASAPAEPFAATSIADAVLAVKLEPSEAEVETTHVDTSAAEEPRSFGAAEEPRSFGAAEEPRSFGAAEDPLEAETTRVEDCAAEEPASLAAAEEPASLAAAEEPASLAAAEEPASLAAAQELPSVAAAEEPPLTGAAENPPSVAVAEELPSLAAAQELPSLAAADEPPSIGVAVAIGTEEAEPIYVRRAKDTEVTPPLVLTATPAEGTDNEAVALTATTPTPALEVRAEPVAPADEMTAKQPVDEAKKSADEAPKGADEATKAAAEATRAADEATKAAAEATKDEGAAKKDVVAAERGIEPIARPSQPVVPPSRPLPRRVVVAAVSFAGVCLGVTAGTIMWAQDAVAQAKTKPAANMVEAQAASIEQPAPTAQAVRVEQPATAAQAVRVEQPAPAQHVAPAEQAAPAKQAAPAQPAPASNAMAVQVPAPTAVERTAPRTPAQCTLDISSSIAGSTVFINKRDRGLAPATASVTCGRPVTIEVRRARYASFQQTVTPTAERQVVKAKLERERTTVTLTSNPPAAVTLDGVTIGKTPMTTTVPRFEQTTFRFAAPGYESDWRRILPKTKQSTVTLTLKPR